MFKIIFLSSVLLVAGCLADIDDLDNFIDYGENHFRGAPIPYAYYPKPERVVVKPVTPYFGEGDNKLTVSVVPDVAAVEATKFGLISHIISFTFGLMKKGISFVLGHASALIIGTLAALGLCNFTPICSKFSAIQSLVEVQREIRSLATPERLATATEFVKKAIKKYRSLQDSE